MRGRFWWVGGMAVLCAASTASAQGRPTPSEVEVLSLARKGAEDGRQIASKLAWEIRKRTSVDPVLDPGQVSLTQEALFESPFLYWRGKSKFPELNKKEVRALRRFVRRGGMVLVDDASAGGRGFDASIRRTLQHAFPAHPLGVISRDHTLFRSFFLLDGPVGRVRGPSDVEGIEIDGRLAVLYTRHDLGGALQQGPHGTWSFSVVPGGERQREQAIRFAVNILLYALCLDYKDDQVHAPFIMRRRGSSP